MKRLILGMIITFMLAIMPVISQAEEVTPPTIQYGFLSLNGATHYLPLSSIVAVGPSIEFARYKELVSFSADFATALVKETQERTTGEKIDKDNFIGGSGRFYLAQLIAGAGGQWLADTINPSLGIGFLANVTDIEDIEIEPSASLNFINYSFTTP